MAKNKDYRPRTSPSLTEVIIESELVKEMKDSYIDYAVSVTRGAAPCRTCGTALKPVTGGSYIPYEKRT